MSLGDPSKDENWLPIDLTFHCSLSITSAFPSAGSHAAVLRLVGLRGVYGLGDVLQEPCVACVLV